MTNPTAADIGIVLTGPTTPEPETLRIHCDQCGGVHVGDYHHEGDWGQGAIFAVYCDVTNDGLVDFYNRGAAAL